MSKYLIEEAQWPPAAFHYVAVRPLADTPEQRLATEETLKRQGCTRIAHVVPVPGSDEKPTELRSYGTVEPHNVVQQRIMMPRYD